LVAAAGVPAAALLATLIANPRPIFLWNASASSPEGLYAVGAPLSFKRGDFAVARPPADARRLAADRRYLPAGVPLVKRVAGVAGDRICARGAHVAVNGRLAAFRRSFDPSGRPMPSWSGCRTLASGEIFLLSSGRPLAFDGRYFGPTSAADIVGRARLLWAR
jgi:conjugative transfer signal peptidase TraF